MSSQIGVITFPGSNGDQDSFDAFALNLSAPTRMIDYRETDLSGLAAIVLPGGFSYGDHLRCGAIARFAPVMESLKDFAEGGGPVLGLCNGFQVLTEAHLLPGALLRNESLNFHCRWVNIRVENARTAWTHELAKGDVLNLPIAHGEGAYFADDATLDRLEANGQVVFRYCEADGTVSPGANFNGSVRSIAGVCNEKGNVVGMMPHPERASDPLLGPTDGLKILTSALEFLNVGV
ncbi:MAG: phosphoribosylformylglycinamidine synthase subunit PurQ [Thermomicrobiales bacterium]